MMENKGVPVEEASKKAAAGGRESAQDYDLRPGPRRDCQAPEKAFPQSTAAVDNFVGNKGAQPARGRQIKALDNLPPI
ncbi:hypothetical protein [Roseateles asaccharophilus]|uniref:Uncharacterized protein n=1 Tax=Roseateles asaccharophilus TaxID=582607 RepID=A0ABU2A416_9BURK|nr:hypothetical protein [Roseateles asaccharophilus]MDR7331943.1 hypothetical protein [Roseateles asaccharophilus]